jgi:hypothetical protein
LVFLCCFALLLFLNKNKNKKLVVNFSTAEKRMD